MLKFIFYSSYCTVCNHICHHSYMMVIRRLRRAHESTLTSLVQFGKSISWKNLINFDFKRQVSFKLNAFEPKMTSVNHFQFYWNIITEHLSWIIKKLIIDSIVRHWREIMPQKGFSTHTHTRTHRIFNWSAAASVIYQHNLIVL